VRPIDLDYRHYKTDVAHEHGRGCPPDELQNQFLAKELFFAIRIYRLARDRHAASGPEPPRQSCSARRLRRREDALV
jgi:hypothetical protein